MFVVFALVVACCLLCDACSLLVVRLQLLFGFVVLCLVARALVVVVFVRSRSLLDVVGCACRLLLSICCGFLFAVSCCCALLFVARCVLHFVVFLFVVCCCMLLLALVLCFDVVAVS